MTFAPLSRRLALLATLSSALWLAACGGGGGGGNGSTTVRALNLTADLASVDLYTSDTKQFSALATDALADNITIDANTYTLNVKRAGDSTTLLTGSYALSKDKHYTAVIWGRETALRLSTLPEDEDPANITTTNTARVRFFNATTDTGSVDVFLTTSTADLGEAAATQGALTSGTLSGFRDVSATTWRLRVTGAGDPNDVRLDIPAITLVDKQYTTLVLTAGASGVLVNGTLITQQGSAATLKNTKARVRVAASMDASGSVAMTVAGKTVSGGLNSPSVGPYVQVDSGSVDLTVLVNGASVTTGPRSFAAGTDYTVLTYGAAGAGRVVVISDDNRLPSAATRAKIRLVNGVNASAPVTMSLDFLPLATDVVSGAVSAYATVNTAGASRIDVTSTLATDPLYTVSSTTTSALLQGQGVYTVFLLGGRTTPTGVFRKER